MPKRFPIRLPNYDQRLKILTLMLASTPLAPPPAFSFEELARRTDGLSGSDLKETCRNAAMRPVRELMRTKGAADGPAGLAGMEQARKEVRVQGGYLLATWPSHLPEPSTTPGLQAASPRAWRLYHYRLTRLQSRRPRSAVYGTTARSRGGTRGLSGQGDLLRRPL
jgi:SpoVK/Ycf46/Vps4 family AAA+-type ATPase